MFVSFSCLALRVSHEIEVQILVRFLQIIGKKTFKII